MAEARLDLIGRAAANNAALCDAVCRAHGVVGRFDDDAWVSAVRPPPLYPDAITLVAGIDGPRLLDRVDATNGCSVKDSHAALDLSSQPGWSVLFAATWVARRGDLPVAATVGPDEEPWESVSDPAALAEWAGAWGPDGGPRDLWRPEVLDQDLVVLAGRHQGTVVAGAIVNVAADVVGISNLFGSPVAVDPWGSCLTWIAEHLPGSTAVGYESGDDLEAAVDHGFEPIGPLRIWLRPS